MLSTDIFKYIDILHSQVIDIPNLKALKLPTLTVESLTFVSSQ
jgi:hypothetical protein